MADPSTPSEISNSEHSSCQSVPSGSGYLRNRPAAMESEVDGARTGTLEVLAPRNELVSGCVGNLPETRRGDNESSTEVGEMDLRLRYEEALERPTAVFWKDPQSFVFTDPRITHNSVAGWLIIVEL